jgi:hypothetical protein
MQRIFIFVTYLLTLPHIPHSDMKAETRIVKQEETAVARQLHG